jgi:hypothetical protein
VILRLFTVTGRLVELEPEPSADGTRIIEIDLGRIRARTLTGPELPAPDGTGRRLHQCTSAAGPTGVRCASPACGCPDEPLVDAYHAVCHPEVTDKLLADQRATIARQFKRRRK